MPLVFVYAPSLLIVVEGFSLQEFLIAFTGCIVGVFLIGAAFTGYLVAPMSGWQRWLLGFGSLFVFAPGIPSGGIGLALAAPVLILQWVKWRDRAAMA